MEFSHTRVAERKGYDWLNGVTHKDDREIGVRLAEWGHTFKDDKEKRVWLNGSHTQGWQRKGYG